MIMRQYEVVLVSLDPTMGNEIKITRPCLVISPDEMNKYLGTVVVAPLTTMGKNYPTRVAVLFDNRNGAVAIDQIRTIHKRRIIRVIGKISADEIAKCKSVIRETYVD
jgi:mRNA interferase MazF